MPQLNDIKRKKLITIDKTTIIIKNEFIILAFGSLTIVLGKFFTLLILLLDDFFDNSLS